MLNPSFCNEMPTGVKDYLPLDTTRKRFIEDRLRSVYEKWGYQEIGTPTFEFYDTIRAGVGPRLSEQTYKLFDRRGRILALRPDMTTPIARLVATKMSQETKPLRLFYLANVFRYRENQGGRDHEFHQAGLELIGSPVAEADAEVIAIAIHSLAAFGVENLRIGIGHVGVTDGLLEEAGLSREEKDKARELLPKKDFVALEKLVQGGTSSGPGRLLWKAMTRTLDVDAIEAIMPQVERAKTRSALANLGRILMVLKSWGLAERVQVDLSLVRDFEYYTGMIFEGYLHGLGAPIFVGGRYDKLLDTFGLNLGATGYALTIEELTDALKGSGLPLNPRPVDYLVVPTGGESGMAYQEAERLRSRGFVVEMALETEDLQAVLSYARRRGVKSVLYVGADGIRNEDISRDGGVVR